MKGEDLLPLNKPPNILIKEPYTEDPHYNDSICYQRVCCKIEFAVVKKLDRTHLHVKHQ